MPWSGLVRVSGKPSVTFTPESTPRYLIGINPWSWYIATTTSNSPSRSALLRDGVRDSGCGLKAFRRDAYLELPFFDHIHRFMPAMMLREGWRIKTIPVTHRPRRNGRSKYSNLARGLVGIPDLMGVAWLIMRSGRNDSDPR